MYYYKQIIKTIIELGQADSFIIAISELIKQMAVDHLHVIGDIFDRGRYPNLVIEKLMKFHSLDIQWGNHDILWMGAALGNQACIATVVRNSARYNIMWFLWLSPESPFFGKDKMATFESYFVKDSKTHKENKNPYYKLSEDEKYCNKILEEFGLNDEDSHIVNGHIPVKVKDGESPIKANGKLLIIDVGFAKSFREKTGNAGYVLTYNSNGLLLSQTKPFESVSKAIIEEKDIISEIIVKKNGVVRKTVGDTDIGMKLKGEIEDLMELLNAYKNGEIKEDWK